ncbi:hypothetical protein QLQ12_13530 [Actinoplanes sp. NEAU-A12]|uniref:Thiamine biosynthesis protein ThiF n=1 Tax=Actinoplanes sandaracinus TaxID=3045177 RepID=A0ABT6WIS7_9ACTN|nr:hypothetical protein [Actinoplanes sandaracinus]MDI6099618.1 hypothetical protein [Actinoplanes sandaracinus]
MNRTPLPRPTLIPGLPRFWRKPGELQVGLDPAHAVVLELPDPRAAGVLDLLDGKRSERLVLNRAADLGITAGDTIAMLDLLHSAGLVLPSPSLLPPALPATTRHRLTCEAAALALGSAPTRHQPHAGPSPARILRHRRSARVVVSGRGRLGATVAVALAEAGVGHVHPDLSGAVGVAEITGSPLRPEDVGAPRRVAVQAAILRTAPGTGVHPVRRTPASLVVQLAHDEPPALIAAGHAARRQPHLAVAVRDGVAVIGPLVPATGAPCLNCLELHRLDRDVGWTGASAPAAPGGAEPCAVATLLAATAYAVAEVLTFLDGAAPETLGAAVEIAAPGRIRRRTWPPHPGCGCQKRRRRPTFTGPSPHNYQTTS